MTSGRFYVTTPIYYINDAPHLGHAYTTVACDVLARYRRMRGDDVRFLTGTDEHGQKALKTATAQGVKPRMLADRMVARYEAAWRALGIAHDDFIRTTDQRHVDGAQALWRRLMKSGDLYKGTYEGRYCVGCESYYAESELVDGKCPTHETELESVREASWFFRLSAFQDRLLAFYRNRPDFVVPETRMNEVVSFVEMGLRDLSVSRMIPWGVPVPDDPEHVLYVWLDALSNYINALGFRDDSPADFSPFWPADLHVLAKDIVRFHAVYWPAFLMSAGLEPPRQILCHGWLLKDGRKMSKTTGNLADPLKLVEWFGADPVRYYLMREVRLGADGTYSEEAVLDRINTDLANDLGNTLSRITRIVSSNLGGRVPSDRHGDALEKIARAAWKDWVAAMDAHDPQDALRAAWDLVGATNKFLMTEEPWKLAKDEAALPHLRAVMHESAEAMRHVAVMVAPVMPASAREIWKRLGAPGDPFAGLLYEPPSGRLRWGFPEGDEVAHESGLFPRMDKVAFFGAAAAAAAATPPPAETAAPAKTAAPAAPASATPGSPLAKAAIAYEDFAKVALIAAKIVSASRHPQADKLLVLEMDDGSGTPRTICAGMAEHYAPEELAGKTVGIVANLAPRKLRGIVSQGMMLAGSWHDLDGKEQVRVVELPGVPPGSEIR